MERVVSGVLAWETVLYRGVWKGYNGITHVLVSIYWDVPVVKKSVIFDSCCWCVMRGLEYAPFTCFGFYTRIPRAWGARDAGDGL